MSSPKDAAMQTLHHRHAAELRRFALRLTHDRELAEDVVQEVLIKAWRDPQLLERDDRSTRAWLYAVTRNLVVDKWRSAASRHERSTDTLPDRGTADASSLVLDRWLVEDALNGLSSEHRAVINAAYYEGSSVAEIARRLRIPEGTVKSRLHYALRTLRLNLQEKGVTRS